MYHTIVKSIAKKNFELVNQRRFDDVLKGCTKDIHHRFGGTHALGGERHNTKDLRRWFERLAVCAADLKLTVLDVWVKGWPWDTTVIIRWVATETFPDGRPYVNKGVHVIHMAWGKVDSIDANEDSQLVNEFLQARAATGIKEALLPPIES